MSHVRSFVHSGAFVVAFLAAMSLASGVAQGATHTVGASGFDFTTIQAAINDGGTSDGDTIRVEDATHAEQGITVSKNVTIEGKGASNTIVQAHAVEGSATNRVFTVSSSKTVTIRSMTIRHGKAPNGSGDGGNGENGGAVLNQGTLTITDCTITLNRAGNGAGGSMFPGAGGKGGGVYNEGTLTLTGVVISSNRVGSGGTGGMVGSGPVGYGGGLFTTGSGATSITASSVINNNSTSPTAYFGGGICVWNNNMTLSRCTIGGNRSNWGGGGIFLVSSGGTSTVTMTNCTVTGNTTSGQGGGVVAYSESSVSTLSLVNCTINDNTAGITGGGICGFSNPSASVVNLKNSIIANNTATTSGPNLGSAGSATLTYTSQDYNLIRDTSGASIGGTTTHDITGEDPLLEALADNGGPTQTCALKVGSPARNTIPNGTNGMGSDPLNVDQRGSTRPSGAKGDMGAYEVGAIAPTVTTTSATLNGTTGFDAGGDVTDTGGASITQCGVCWNTTGNPTIADANTQDGSLPFAMPFPSNVQDLSENTHYYFRAYATNSAGTSYGEQKTIITGSSTSILGYAWTERTGAGSRDWCAVASSHDATKLVAVVYGGYIYTSSNSGANWAERSAAGSRNWSSIASSADGSKLVAIVRGGYIYTSGDSGTTWTEQTGAGSRDWLCVVSSSDGARLTAAVVGGRLYTSADSGATWTEKTTAGSRNWSNLAASSDGTKLTAATYGGYIYTSNDSGATWTERTSAGFRNWRSLASSSDGTQRVAGDQGGLIYTSADSGVTWIEQSGADLRIWYRLASSADGTNLVAAIYGNYVYASNDAGVTWFEQTRSSEQGWYGVACSSNATKLIACVDGGSIYTAGPPTLPTVTTTSVSSITPSQTEAQSGGEVTDDGGDSVTARGVCWNTTGSPTTSGCSSSDGSGTGTFTSQITGLEPNTTYYVRAYATNTPGTAYGSEVSFSTSTIAPTVSTDTVSSIAATSAACGGDVTANGGADVTDRGVCWNTTGSPTISDSHTTDGTGTGSFTSNLTGLLPNTTYYVRAYATHSADTGYGDERTFTTSQVTYTVMFQAGANGSVQGTASQTVVEGASCSAVTAVPASGYQFSGWSGDYVGSDNPLTISNVTVNMTITANFTEIPATMYTVMFQAGANGSVQGTASQTVVEGASCSAVTAVPASGYQFSGWSGDYVGSDNPLTVTNVTANMTIIAIFAEIPPTTYTVTFQAGANGSIQGTASQTVSGGASCTVTAVPVSGYRFSGWSGDYVGTENPLTISNITRDMTITANFTEEEAGEPNLCVTVQTEGSDPNVPIQTGQQVSFLIRVQNLGTGSATQVVIVTVIPGNMEFVSGRLLAGSSAAAVPADISVNGSEVTIQAGNLPAGTEVRAELILRAKSSGSAVVTPQVQSTETPEAVGPTTSPQLTIEDVYYMIVRTPGPFSFCGLTGLFPLGVVLSGLLALKRGRQGWGIR